MTIMKIFLVEDNEGDVELIKEALEDNGLIFEIEVAIDAQQAETVISRIKNGQFTPSIVILDINVPKGGGLKILKIIKSNEETKYLPVVMFSSSSRVEDVSESYALYANCYIVKPFDLEELISVIGNIHQFWFNTVKLPNSR